MKNLKKKNLAKILVLLLSVALIVTALVLVVGAETGDVVEVTVEGAEAPTYYASLDEAIKGSGVLTAPSETENPPSKVTMKLLADAQVSTRYNIQTSLTIDLGGKTLTANASDGVKPFAIYYGDFLLTGTGTVDIQCSAFVDTQTTASSTSIIGDGGYINIIHDAATYGKTYGTTIGINTSVGTLKNLNIVSKATTVGNVVWLTAGATLNVDGVKINAPLATDASKTFVFNISKGAAATVNMNYCSINTKGMSVFAMGGGHDGILNINNSSIIGKPSADNDAGRPRFIYAGYAALNGDVTVKNSYVEYSAKISGVGSGKLYLDNSTLAGNVNNGELSRTMPIKMSNGSKIISVGGVSPKTHQFGPYAANCFTAEVKISDTETKTVNGIALLITEGSRFDAAIYNRITNAGNYKPINADMAYINNALMFDVNNCFYAFPDGSSPLSSLTYDIVYDPEGCPEAPYLVVKTGEVTYGEATSDSTIPENKTFTSTGSGKTYDVVTTYTEYTATKIPVTSSKFAYNNGTVTTVSGYYTIIEKTASTTATNQSTASDTVTKTWTITEMIGTEESSASTGMGFPTFEPISDTNGVVGEKWHIAIGENNQGGTLQTVTKDGNEYTTYTPNGTTDGSNPTFMTAYGSSYVKGKTEASNQTIFVFSVDISAEQQDKFTEIESLGMNARHTYNGGGPLDVYLLKMSNTGLVSFKAGTAGDVSSVSLTAGQWNNITFVVDPNYSDGYRIFGFVNGQYLGYVSKTGVNANQMPTLNIYGIRFNVLGGDTGASSNDTMIMLDNDKVVTYPAYKNENGQIVNITDKIAKKYYSMYAASGNSAYNSEDVSAKNITIAGVPVYDLDEAIKIANNNGLIAELTGDVTAPATITSEGTIITNGYTISNFTSESTVAYKIEKENGSTVSYDFNTKYNEYEIPVKFYLGDFGKNEDNWFTPEASMKIFDSISDAFTSSDTVSAYGYFDSKNHYLSCDYIGWSLTEGNLNGEIEAVLSSETVIEYYENPENWDGETLKPMPLYPVYDSATCTKKFNIVVIKANGAVDTSRSITSTELWNSAYNSLAVQYGETILLQNNLVTQNNFGRAWQYAKNAENKTINLDLNGYTIIFDQNHNQTTYDGIGKVNGSIPVKIGETINLYSSRAGGRIVNYGAAYTEAASVEISRTESSESATVPAAQYSKYDSETNSFTQIYSKKIQENDVWYTVTYSQVKTMDMGVSGGSIFTMNSGLSSLSENSGNTQNMHLNVGKVEYKDYNTGEAISTNGSNLTLEASAIVDLNSADASCTVNIDGVTAVSNSADYPAIFTVKKFYGNMTVKNSTLLATANSLIFSSSKDGAEYDSEGALVDYAKGTVLFHNCEMWVNGTGTPIINQLRCMSSIKFTDCVTNGKYDALNYDKANMNHETKLIVGEGSLSAYVIPAEYIEEGTVSANWNNPTAMMGDKTSVTANTFTFSETLNWGASGQNYTKRYTLGTYTFALAEGEGVDFVLPATMVYKVVNTADALTVTYNGITEGKAQVVTYSNGAKALEAPEIEGFAGTAITVTVTGIDKEIPETITESLVINPVYTVTSNVTGIKANVSLYSDFAVNLYIPAEYAQYIAVTVDGASENAVDASIAEVAYNKYTAYRQAYNSENDVTVAYTVSEGGFTAEASITINVVSYAKKVIDASEDKTTEAVQLMYHMLKYAQAANTYYAGNVPGVAVSANITAALEGATVTAYDYTADTKTVDPAIASIIGAIDLDSTYLAYVFEIPAELQDKVSVKIGDAVYEETNGKIVIRGLKIYTFAEDFTIIVDGVAYDYNLATLVGAYADNATVLPMVDAFYQFAKAAEAYMN